MIAHAGPPAPLVADVPALACAQAAYRDLLLPRQVVDFPHHPFSNKGVVFFFPSKASQLHYRDVSGTDWYLLGSIPDWRKRGNFGKGKIKIK